MELFAHDGGQVLNYRRSLSTIRIYESHSFKECTIQDLTLTKHQIELKRHLP